MSNRLTALISTGLLLLLFGSLLFEKRRGILYHLSVWRADALVEKSITLGDQEQWKEASQIALASNQLLPGRIAALRQLYRSSLRAKADFLLSSARSLFSHPEATFAERVEVVRLFFGLGDQVTVAALLGEFPESEQSAPELLEIKARLLLLRNRPFDAYHIAEHLGKLRDNPEDILLAAESLARISSDQHSTQAEAQVLIHQLMGLSGPGDLALRAFALLGKIPREVWDVEQFASAESRLQEHLGGAAIPLPLRLLLTELEMRRSPERKTQILQDVIATESRENREALGEWLSSINEPQLVRSLFTKEEWGSSVNWYTLVVQSYLQELNWKKATEMLENPAPGIDPTILFGLRAIVTGAQDNDSGATQWWERGFRQAEIATGRNSLLQLAKLAASSGNEPIRNRAIAEALKRPSAIPIPSSDVAFVFSYLVEQDRPDDLLRISQGLLTNEPNNLLLINNVAWLSLLQHQTDSDSITKLEHTLANHSSVTGIRTTLALAYLQSGRLEAAETVLEGIPEKDKSGTAMKPSDRAVWALFYEKQGKVAEAKELCEGLEWNRMMRLEREYFQDALGIRVI